MSKEKVFLGRRPESPGRPEMVVSSVGSTILRSGIPFANEVQALNAFQIPFRNVMTAAREAAKTQEKLWSITFSPNSLSETSIKKMGDGLWVVSFKNPETEATIAQQLDIQRGLEHARANVALAGGTNGELSLDFDQIIAILNKSGITTQLTGQKILKHFAEAAKKPWGTDSRLSPSLTADKDDLQVRIELGHGVLRNQLHERWHPNGSVLQTPFDPEYDTFHIRISPRELPTFDPAVISRAENITNNLVASFRAMQPQA